MLSLNKCICRFEFLSKRMTKIKDKARLLYNEGQYKKSCQYGDVIAKIAEVRLKYIYQ